MKIDRSRLSDDDVAERIAALDGWALDGAAIRRTLKFATFPDAWGFMTVVAVHAQSLDHHPDWSNSYTTVEVSLTSHDVHGLSERDFHLARLIDEAASRFV